MRIRGLSDVFGVSRSATPDEVNHACRKPALDLRDAVAALRARLQRSDAG